MLGKTLIQEQTMNRPDDIASFPPLFDELEAFCSEQLGRIRWASLAIAIVTVVVLL